VALSVNESTASRAEKLRIFVRVAVFLLFVWAGRMVFPALIGTSTDPLVASALSVFATSVLANAVGVRGWEQGRLADLGLAWSNVSGRQLLTGLGLGAGATASVLGALLLFQVASYEEAEPTTSWKLLPLVIVVLALGAMGEELLFHGYAFQQLARQFGDFGVVLPVGVLFGVAHLQNNNVGAWAVVNTIAWGILLGFAWVRTRSLWLSIGLHFGWNLAAPFAGVNLSGFTMRMTGYQLNWRPGSWLSGGAYGLEGSAFTVAVVMLLGFVLYRITSEEITIES